MGNMVWHLENTTSSSSASMHHLRNLWQSPRGTVLRIQALAVVAIIITFFLAAFGSCRRWSNRWIVQKGFFAAHALSLSLGTYSIGLMQSSSVKSEMYPIWTVCLFSLFVCVDPVTAYNGFDYKGPLSKLAYGICLNCGYVLLMSISTTSRGVSRASIIMLSVITFIKGFHGSLALVEQSRKRNMLLQSDARTGYVEVLRYDYATVPQNLQGARRKTVDDARSKQIDRPEGVFRGTGSITVDNVDELLKVKEEELSSCYNVCIALCLSQDLQQHLLGLGSGRTRTPNLRALKDIKYKWALEVIEIELAFVYEEFFTGSSFFHYYQGRTASLWALASFIGICFVGVATAIPGGTTTTIAPGADGGCTKAVNTTTADLVVTFVILVSLALLQLMHLIRCWTSNWARVAVVRAYARNRQKESWFVDGQKTPYWRTCWMRLKALVATSTNWFDKYLWQDKIGQYSMVPEGRLLTEGKMGKGSCCLGPREYQNLSLRNPSRVRRMIARVYKKCFSLVKILGLDYLWLVLWDLLGNDTNKKGAIRLEDEVKESIIDFLGKIQTDRLYGNTWLLSSSYHPTIKRCLPYSEDSIEKSESHGFRYTKCVMMWHAATWFCELAEQEKEKQDATLRTGTAAAASYFKGAAAGCLKKAAAERNEKNRNRRVANALSKYCVYLVVSAPELLPGPVSQTARARQKFSRKVTDHLSDKVDKILGALSDPNIWTDLAFRKHRHGLTDAVGLAKVLLGDHPPLHGATRPSDPWETLVHVWVRLLIYAAPYGNVEAHMRRLPQGGEFITHLWALLYHLDIREWKLEETNLHYLATVQDFESVLNKNDHAAVIGFIHTEDGHYDHVLAAAARLEDGVPFYQIFDVDVARRFDINLETMQNPIVFLKKDKFTLYDGEFRAYDIARFVTASKFGSAKTREESTIVWASIRAQESRIFYAFFNIFFLLSTYTDPPTLRNFANQSSEHGGGQNEDEIDEEGSDDGGGQIQDKILTEERSHA